MVRHLQGHAGDRHLPDFIVVDGAEGGTGAAPLEFTDHVGAPLQEGLLLVHNTLVGLNLRSKIKIGCAGKVISAFDIARAMALGADWCNAARGFMFALGCIQAQACHTGACPTGVATQDPRRQRRWWCRTRPSASTATTRTRWRR
jgi:glutamate synthase domain-containing protein 2